MSFIIKKNNFTTSVTKDYIMNSWDWRLKSEFVDIAIMKDNLPKVLLFRDLASDQKRPHWSEP